MNAADYIQGLKQRLPTGDAWPTSDESDGTSAWDQLLAALAQEPTRVDTDALALIDKVIPDNADTDLVEWEKIVRAPDENLTDEERLGRIRSILRSRGEVDLVTLQSAIRALASDDNVKLFNRAYPYVRTGALSAGTGCDDQPHLWLCELYPNLNTFTPDTADDLAEWVGFSAATIGGSFADSPVSLAACSQVTFAAATPVEREIPNVPNGSTLRMSFWIYWHTTHSVTIEVFDRAGASVYGEARAFTPDVWHRVSITVPAGTGGADPKLSLTTAAGEVADLSWFCAGLVDTSLEARVRALVPMHTRGVIAIQGEYELLLAQTDGTVAI
jgi:hypothetical protein